MADTLPPDLREAAQAAHIALTCISTHPTLDMSDYLRGRVDAAAAGLEAALAAVPARTLTDEQIDKISDRIECWSGYGLGAKFNHRAFARAVLAAAPQAVPVVNQQLTTEAQAVPVPAAPPMPQPAGQVEVFEPWISTRKVAHGFKRRVDVFLLEQIEERDRQWLAMLAAGPKEQP